TSTLLCMLSLKRRSATVPVAPVGVSRTGQDGSSVTNLTFSTGEGIREFWRVFFEKTANSLANPYFLFSNSNGARPTLFSLLGPLINWRPNAPALAFP